MQYKQKSPYQLTVPLLIGVLEVFLSAVALGGPSPHSYSGVFLNQKSGAEERGAVDLHVRLNLEKKTKNKQTTVEKRLIKWKYLIYNKELHQSDEYHSPMSSKILSISCSVNVPSQCLAGLKNKGKN